MDTERLFDIALRVHVGIWYILGAQSGFHVQVLYPRITVWYFLKTGGAQFIHPNTGILITGTIKKKRKPLVNLEPLNPNP